MPLKIISLPFRDYLTDLAGDLHVDYLDMNQEVLIDLFVKAYIVSI